MLEGKFRMLRVLKLKDGTRFLVRYSYEFINSDIYAQEFCVSITVNDLRNLFYRLITCD